jgi:predicted RNase H-like HicB family nuclease
MTQSLISARSLAIRWPAGCVSQGHTKEEATANIQEAIQLCLEVGAEKGLPLTIETRSLDIAV